jgi:hypothetical protein
VYEERTSIEHGGGAQAQADDVHAQAPENAEFVFELPEAPFAEPDTAIAEESGGSESPAEADERDTSGKQPKRRSERAPRKTAAKRAKKAAPRSIGDIPEIAAPAEAPAGSATGEEAPAPAKKAARKSAPRSRRPRKTAATSDAE